MTLTRTFNFDRDTKNKRRFKEVNDSEGDEVVGTLYIRKSVAKGAAQLILTIEIPE